MNALLDEGDVKVIIPLNPDISREEALNFEFQPLIDRMVDKHGWAPEEACEVFEDTKRFLFMCAASPNGPFAPSEKIDEMWHNFILFTKEYREFCQDHFGFFLDHRPRKRTDPPATRDLRADTLMVATVLFGDLSSNWQYPVKAQDECEQGCVPSTNCQDG